MAHSRLPNIELASKDSKLAVHEGIKGTKMRCGLKTNPTDVDDDELSEPTTCPEENREKPRGQMDRTWPTGQE